MKKTSGTFVPEVSILRRKSYCEPGLDDGEPEAPDEPAAFGCAGPSSMPGTTTFWPIPKPSLLMGLGVLSRMKKNQPASTIRSTAAAMTPATTGVDSSRWADVPDVRAEDLEPLGRFTIMSGT